MQKTDKPTDRELDRITADWLGENTRDENSIFKDTMGAIVHRMRKNESFSEYLLGKMKETSSIEDIKKARNITQSIINVISNNTIKVTFGTGGSSTNGKEINIATKQFDRTDLTLNQKLDITLGYAIHEALHIRHTTFSQENLKNPMLLNTIENILDDERIEHLLGMSTENGGDGMPGYSDFLGQTKQYVFGKYATDLKELKKSSDRNDRLTTLINLLLCAIRFPAALNREDVAQHYQMMLEMKKEVTPFPLKEERMKKAARRIYNLLSEEMKNEQKQEQKQNGGQQENPKNNGEPGDGNQPQNPEEKKPGNENQQAPNQAAEGNKEQKDANRQSDKSINEQFKECISLQNLLNDILNSSKTDNPDKTSYSLICSSDDTNYVNGMLEKNEGAGADTIKYIGRATQQNKTRYNSLAAATRRLVPAVAKAFRCQMLDRDFTEYGKTGKLNTKRFAALISGNENIFVRRGRLITDGACICLLIDESESMNSRLYDTQCAAILINEATKKIGKLEFFAYGFRSKSFTIYAERNNVNKHALASTTAQGGTPTGEAIATAVTRIRRMTQNKCIMIVITDGKPGDFQRTREAILQAKKDGFMTIGLDISQSGSKVCSLFDEAIVIDNLSQMPKMLSNIIKTKLNRITTKRVSMTD